MNFHRNITVIVHNEVMSGGCRRIWKNVVEEKEEKVKLCQRRVRKPEFWQKMFVSSCQKSVFFSFLFSASASLDEDGTTGKARLKMVIPWKRFHLWLFASQMKVSYSRCIYSTLSCSIEVPYSAVKMYFLLSKLLLFIIHL